VFARSASRTMAGRVSRNICEPRLDKPDGVGSDAGNGSWISGVRQPPNPRLAIKLPLQNWNAFSNVDVVTNGYRTATTLRAALSVCESAQSVRRRIGAERRHGKGDK
jgi:hypothetical protein